MKLPYKSNGLELSSPQPGTVDNPHNGQVDGFPCDWCKSVPTTTSIRSKWLKVRSVPWSPSGAGFADRLAFKDGWSMTLDPRHATWLMCHCPNPLATCQDWPLCRQSLTQIILMTPGRVRIFPLSSLSSLNFQVIIFAPRFLLLFDRFLLRADPHPWLWWCLCAASQVSSLGSPDIVDPRGFPLWLRQSWLMSSIDDSDWRPLHFFTSNWWLVWYTGILVYQWVSSSLPHISSSYPNITKRCNLNRYLSHGHWFSGIELPGFPILGHGKSLSAALSFVNGIDGSLSHHVKIWSLGLYHVII